MTTKQRLGYHEAAERREVKVSGWVCLNCSTLFPDEGRQHGITLGGSRDAERAARYCCTRETPCASKGCAKLGESPYTLCSEHLAVSRAERWEKRERRPWRPGLMLFSEAFDEWFADPDEAEDWLELNAGPGERGEAARIRIGEPVYAPPFELARQVEDELPDDDDDPRIFHDEAIAKAADALNKALADFGPISWRAGEHAWDGTTEPAEVAP